MALNDTQMKTLKSLTLTDLILPQAALENIVENNELKDILNSYVPLSSYTSLAQKVEAIESTGISSYDEDRDSLSATNQQLCTIVSGLNIRVNELNETVQQLCALIQTSTQHTISFNSNFENETNVDATTQNSAIQLLATMPEKNEFAVAEDQLPIEEPSENQQTQQVISGKSRKKKHR